MNTPVDQTPKPSLKLVLEGKVDLEASIHLGESDSGHRAIVGIKGGTFKGEDLNATVNPGGADWQLVRADGVWEIRALYAITTDDGATIVIDNQGIITGLNKLGQPIDEPYARTTPKFHAPQGKYDWLNQNVFVGTITPEPSPQPSYVLIHIFRVS